MIDFDTRRPLFKNARLKSLTRYLGARKKGKSGERGTRGKQGGVNFSSTDSPSFPHFFPFPFFPSPFLFPKRRVHKLEQHWQKGSRVLGGKKHTRLVKNFGDTRFPSCFKTGFKNRPCISLLSQKRLLDLSPVIVSRLEGSDNLSICVCQEFVLLSLLQPIPGVTHPSNSPSILSSLYCDKKISPQSMETKFLCSSFFFFETRAELFEVFKTGLSGFTHG